MSKVLCCPLDRQAKIVTMRPNPKDAWYVEGGVTIEFQGRLPNGDGKFLLKSESASPEVATLQPNVRIALPAEASMVLLRFEGVRALLAVCYVPGKVACRASSRKRLLGNAS